MKCSCGHDFNRKIWHNAGDAVQYGYQCYSSICIGTIKTRLNKGLPIEGICETPMIAGWKLQMMAKYIYNNYLADKQEILALAESLLEKHIGDKEIVEDNSAIIEQKNEEFAKLQKRLDNLIEMRADGEISRDIFQSKKADIQDRMVTLQKELSELVPKEVEEAVLNYEEKITMLKYALERYTDFSDALGKDIPEEVIEAFVEKIVVSKDSFEWYLRFSPDDDPKRCNVIGRGQRNASVMDISPSLVHSSSGSDC